MAIVIRHQFNNRGWADACQNPGRDQRCHKCFEKNVNIVPPKWTDSVCSGICWDRNLRAEYRWGYAPKGKLFGRRAQIGDDVFLVFRQVTKPQLYTLWAVTKVASIDKRLRKSGGLDENGYSFMYFEAFDPLQEDRWVPDLTADDLVGKPWGQGNHRYLNEEKADRLRDRIR